MIKEQIQQQTTNIAPFNFLKIFPKTQKTLIFDLFLPKNKKILIKQRISRNLVKP